jgi:FKBP-type peptidyl-prolyl cis-trans isomerase
MTVMVLLATAGGGGEEVEEDAAAAGAEADVACAELVDYDSADVRTTDSGLGVLEISEGSGRAVEAGDTLRVHYTGCLTDGTRFDSSYDRGEPFGSGQRPFVVGQGQVIQGWDEGIPGMRPGGERLLVIPSELAYGERGAGGGVIPPNATLVFKVELVGYGQEVSTDTAATETGG